MYLHGNMGTIVINLVARWPHMPLCFYFYFNDLDQVGRRRLRGQRVNEYASKYSLHLRLTAKSYIRHPNQVFALEIFVQHLIYNFRDGMGRHITCKHMLILGIT